jgi:hypothetical protein
LASFLKLLGVRLLALQRLLPTLHPDLLNLEISLSLNGFMPLANMRMHLRGKPRLRL